MRLPYTVKAKKAIDLAGKMSKSLHHSYIGTEHLLLGLLKEGTGVAAQVLREYGVEADKVLKLIEELIAPGTGTAVMEKGGYSPKMQAVLEGAAKDAERFHAEAVGTEHLLLAILREKECIAARLLYTLSVNLQKAYADTLTAMGEDTALYREEIQGRGRRKSGNGTQTLDQYSRDLTALAREGSLDPVIGREAEIGRVIQILSRRTKNNPCLIGEPGVGKTAIVEGIAQRIVSGLVPDSVLGKRVVSLDLSGIVAGSKYRGEFEERIKKIIQEVTIAGNILLFIDELHTIIGAGGAEGAIDASNILKPALARGEIQIMGATTITEYRKYVEKDAALERRFQPVTVEEPTEEQSIEILKGLRSKYEQHHHVTITDEAVEAAVKLSARYINDRFLPDKAIDLMDEASAKVRFGMANHSEELAKLKQLIVANKCDAYGAEEKLAEFKSKLGRKKVIEISALTGKNLEGLKKAIYEVLSKLPPVKPLEYEEFNYVKPEKLDYEILKEGETFVIVGTLVDVLKRNVVLDDMNSLAYMHKVLRDRGIIDELRKMGATDKSTVIIGGEEFEFID